MKEPIEPHNERVQVEIFSSGSCISLQEILELSEKNSLEPKDVFIEADLDNNWGDYSSRLDIYYYKSKYTEEEFAKKMKEYNEKKKAYAKWLKEDFPKIEKERLDKEIARLEMQKASL